MRRSTAAVVTATAIALVLPATTATAAHAASTPGFLAPADLPPHPSSDWYAGEVTAGTPDPLPFCYGQALPGATSRHREFWTELDATARQVTVVEKDTASAERLADLLHRTVRQCAARTEAQYPDVDATGRSLGRVNVEEGARLYAVQVDTEYTRDIHLFSVGRDGRTVTVVQWGQMGRFKDAPVAAFRDTARTSVAKLD
ncbi:hypothetical protein [Streptomyces sp. UH6]|uniref:hypothetical protein n=1 Tax=Streptomyces sp. UH6 TaxID=2748379 RepID=UPI0015D4A60F|nr:hypothetical protein [Streptomyces sp. UH6]NYV78253.1 hypothetical protein [Streptomyces sp. UH6]